MTKDLLIFGIQGSGKGTQAALIAERHNGAILGTGDILRGLATNTSSLAQQVKEQIDRGELVADETMKELVFEHYEGLREQADMIIFDGYPRNLAQIPHFEEIMEREGRDFVVIYLDLPKGEAMERIKSRFAIEGREDDKDMTAVENRMNTFLDQTLPVVEHYRAQGKVLDIDGSPSVEEVSRLIEQALQEMGDRR